MLDGLIMTQDDSQLKYEQIPQAVYEKIRTALLKEREKFDSEEDKTWVNELLYYLDKM